jgi:hypothetical protein
MQGPFTVQMLCGAAKDDPVALDLSGARIHPVKFTGLLAFIIRQAAQAQADDTIGFIVPGQDQAGWQSQHASLQTPGHGIQASIGPAIPEVCLAHNGVAEASPFQRGTGLSATL